MVKVKVFVVTHKVAKIPEEEVLVPIQVGHSLSVPLAGMIGDDTGVNISGKNPQYCEMTAHYWIWKNIKDIEYVGVCHYRRYLGIDISERNIDELMADCDVIMVEPSFYLDSVYSYFAKFMGAENMTILWMVMKKICPEYVDALENVCDGVKFHPFNMLLCRKALFDEYSEWMFNILQECEKYVKLAPYTNARRTLAYMAELLTGVYFLYRGMKIRSVPYYKIEDGNRILVSRTEEQNQMMEMFERLLLTELAEKVKEDRKEKFENPAVLLGLKKDEISID